MEIILLLLTALAPGVLLLVFIRRMDMNEKEPLGLVMAALFMGILSTIPAIILESLLEYLPIYGGGGLWRAFAMAFFQVAWVEEAVKLLFVYLLVRKNRNFSEENDGIVYFGAGALGFAIFENIFYVLSHGFGTGILRAVSAVPMHCFTGVVMGFFMGKAQMELEVAKRRKMRRQAFFYPFLLHGIYDALLMTEAAPFIILVIPFVVGMIVFGVWIMKRGRVLSLIRSSLAEGKPDDAGEIWRQFEISNPKNQLWKIIVSRSLMVFMLIFLIILFVAVHNDWKNAGESLSIAILAGAIVLILPLLAVIMLESSYFRRKKQHLLIKDSQPVQAISETGYPQIPENVTAHEEKWPPGQLWRAIAGRSLLVIGLLIITFFALVFMADFSDYKHQWLTWLMIALFFSFPFFFPGILAEHSFRVRRKRFSELAKTIPPRQITINHLTLSPPGQLWKIIISRPLMGVCAMLWLIIPADFSGASEKNSGGIVETLLILAFFTAIPLIPALILELSYQKRKRAHINALQTTAISQ